jgi:hypothetical protein
MKALCSIALVLAFGAACGPAPQTPAAAAELRWATDLPPFARSDARLSVAHAGTRRFEFPRASGALRSYRERIVTDGHGRFALEPLEAHAGTPAQQLEFELTQRVRQGFLFRYRDFVVRDATLFARNWTVTLVGRSGSVAARVCDEYRLERTTGRPLAIELAVDQETDLILASREYDSEGELTAEMAYDTFQRDPDLAAVVWHEPSNDEQPLDAADPRVAEHELLRPRLLPEGFAALETARVADGQGEAWVKRTYSDGVEPLFFLQGLEAGIRRTGPAGGVMSAQLRPQASSVTVFDLGTAKAIQGEVEGFQLLVVGRASEAELLDLIESSLP